MDARMIAGGICLFLLGGLAGLGWPVSAGAQVETCVAPWRVVVNASSAGNSGWHGVKWNRCTGEAHVIVVPGLKLDEPAVWRNLPIK
jgi:hypothetical protein